MAVSVLVCAAGGPAAAQDVEGGIVFAGNVYGCSEGSIFHTATPKTQVVDVKHGVSYGRVNWTSGLCTAGLQWRIDNEAP
jgi:hypothetical protein